MRFKALPVLTFVLAALLLPVYSAAANPPADYLEAIEFCDRADLRPIEGLWTYPDDEVTVLIFRNESNARTYDIFVVESADCSLNPRMKLGELTESPDPDKFSMKLFTKVKNGVLSLPRSATATYNENKESLTVKSNSLKIRINPLRLLPSFWRIASVSFNTGEGAPEGMIKVYPSYDGNNSTRRGPRYL